MNKEYLAQLLTARLKEDKTLPYEVDYNYSPDSKVVMDSVRWREDIKSFVPSGYYRGTDWKPGMVFNFNDTTRGISYIDGLKLIYSAASDEMKVWLMAKILGSHE